VRATLRLVATGLMLPVAAGCASPDPGMGSAPELSPGSSQVVVEAIPEDALPGAAASAVELDRSVLAGDAIDVASLGALLSDAGFVAGTERRFSQTAAGRRRATARVLAFETAAGAERYVEWVADHVQELIGDAQVMRAAGTPAEAVVFVHEPSGCCHLETRLFLGAWRRGATVITLKLAGQGVRLSTMVGFASRLDAAV
jgi:hypothetical protein